MINLSVNVNKFALLRNSRGTNIPDLENICNQILNYGANGIAVHRSMLPSITIPEQLQHNQEYPSSLSSLYPVSMS